MFRTAGLLIAALTLVQVPAQLAKPMFVEDPITRDFIRSGSLKEAIGLHFENLNEERNDLDVPQPSSSLNKAWAPPSETEPKFMPKSDSDERSLTDSDSNSDSASEEDPESPEIADLLKKLIVKVKVKVKVNNNVKRKIKIKCVDKF